MPSRYANLDPRHTPHGFGDVFRWSVLDRLTGRRRPTARLHVLAVGETVAIG